MLKFEYMVNVFVESFHVEAYGILVLATFSCWIPQSSRSCAHYCQFFSPLTGYPVLEAVANCT